MNILVPDSWLKEHLKTKAKPKQIAKYLSLCSQSVEKISRTGNDWVYEIEITTNRPDCLSVYGIARELAAILPRFGTQAKLNPIKEAKIKIPVIKKSLPLKVEIRKPSLCPRFTALIFDKVVIKPSPKIIQERLKGAGIRALNNVVDISNYLMLELGQPMHTFDYDKIKGAKMIVRESAGGEKITTLDGQIRPLPDGTIIIEDAEARIIDLCGIMGGANSEVNQKTKRVLLFVQTYNPVKIREACQALAFQTDAASRFEKGVEPEGIILAMKKAVVMFKKLTGAKVASKLIDIYPHPQQPKTASLTVNQVKKLLGIEIHKKEIIAILESLGFVLSKSNNSQLTFTIPHWRHDDISIPEDLIEEVARLYGYHNLPATLPESQIAPAPKDFTFYWENRAKDSLKFWGFTETASYSMTGPTLLEKANFNLADHLKISNPLNKDLVYMRTSLIPSLLEIIKTNQATSKEIKIFELANVYIPQEKNQLPEEGPMLTAAITGNKFYQAKGITEALLRELGISDFRFEPYTLKKTIFAKIFHPVRTAEIMVKNDSLGILGEIHPLIRRRFGIKKRLAVFDLDFQQLTKHASTTKKYIPIPKYPAIIEDLSFVVSPKTLVGELIQLIKESNSIIRSVELVNSYQDIRTIRLTCQNPRKTLTDKEVKKIREKIIEKAKKELGATLKS